MSAKRRALLASLVLSAAAVIAAPQAEANSGAGGTIINTITVNYKDASGTTSYSASASASVTINQVKAGLTYSGAPTSANKGITAAFPTSATTTSGAIQSYVIALTANANGGDSYNLSEATGSLTNMASQSVTWNTVKTDGTTAFGAANPTILALGASVIQANSANTISIPGGSTLASAIQLNSAGNKVIVVNGIDYLVSLMTPGVKPLNSNGGGTFQTTVGTVTPEVLDVITLVANPNGAIVAPAFGVNALIGSQAGEQVLVKVNVTGVVGASVGVAGVVPFTLTTTDGAGGHSLVATTITTTFNASNLQIRKTVRNCGQATAVGTCGAGAYAGTATGNPGDILEYKVEVQNAGASSASVVSASDAVPVYTTLLPFATSTYGDGGTLGTGLATDFFASVTDGSTTGSLTLQSTDAEVANVGAGDAAGIAANSAIHFYLGTGSTKNTGGSIAAGKTYTILYRMKMN